MDILYNSTILTIILIILIVVTTIAVFMNSFFSEGFDTSHKHHNMRFTDVSEFGQIETKVKKSIDETGIQIMKDIPKLKFSSNYSKKTRQDLADIKQKMSKLTPERTEEIRKQNTFQGMIEDFSIKGTDLSRSSDGLKLAYALHTDIDPIILNLKAYFNRPRPYHLDKSIIPIIDPPKHPSYPSGHSTQSHMIALWLCEKYPQRRKFYRDVAERIGINREYAGVHYSEDTEYGKYVANYLFSNYFSGSNNPLLE
jgi:hypothetical protein